MRTLIPRPGAGSQVHIVGARALTSRLRTVQPQGHTIRRMIVTVGKNLSTLLHYRSLLEPSSERKCALAIP